MEKNILRFKNFLEARRELLKRYLEKNSLPEKVVIKGETYKVFVLITFPTGEECIEIYFNKGELPY